MSDHVGSTLEVEIRQAIRLLPDAFEHRRVLLDERPLPAPRMLGLDALDRKRLRDDEIDLAPKERFLVGKSCRKRDDDGLVLSA